MIADSGYAKKKHSSFYKGSVSFLPFQLSICMFMLLKLEKNNKNRLITAFIVMLSFYTGYSLIFLPLS